jgi:hypothetical protein
VDTRRYPDWPSEPTLRDRLLYGIGRVCEDYALLDWTLGMVQTELAIWVNPGKPEAAYKGTTSTSVRIDRCQELLARSPLPGDLIAAGDVALEDTRAVNSDRARVVHDAWGERIDAGDGPAFNRVQITKAGLIYHGSDLEFVHDVEQCLERACEQLHALVEATGRVRNAAGHWVPEGLSYTQLLPAIRGNPQG